MWNKTISVDQVIGYLNELLESDGPAVVSLITNRVPCNEKMGTHPSVQVGFQQGGYTVGLMGVLNGLFGVKEDGKGLIRYIVEDGYIIRFERND